MKIIFAGGGTAGHVNPALAIASYIKRHEPAEIFFSGGSGNIEERIAQKEGIPIFTFPMQGLSRSLSLSGIKRNITAVSQTMSAIKQCKKILLEQKPDIVVGTGGYASFPMTYAATKCGIKTAIIEVNAMPGVAIKLLAKKVDAVLISYSETEKLISGAKKIILTGSPVREEFYTCKNKQHKPIFDNDLPILLSFWGSVGAKYMNEKMLEMLKLTAQKKQFNCIHAAGKNYYESMKKQLKQAGIDSDTDQNVRLFEYIYNMDEMMGAADLVMSRAGGTLSELCAAGLGSIIVPSPYVAENHQEKNARILEKAGASVVITEAEATPELLYDAVHTLITDKERLERMGQFAKGKSQEGALPNIYKAIRQIAGKGTV